MEPIDIPAVEQTDSGNVNFATEVAFAMLLKTAKNAGMELTPVMGLMYLPDQTTTRQFQEACRAVLTSLRPLACK